MDRLWVYNHPVEPARGCPADSVEGWSMAVGETHRQRIGECPDRQIGQAHF